MVSNETIKTVFLRVLRTSKLRPATRGSNKTIDPPNFYASFYIFKKRLTLMYVSCKKPLIDY